MRSFGTEDRPTANPVAGRDAVYDYIIFKATDIKDLIVCETPKPVPQLQGGLAYDPAILTVSTEHAIPQQGDVAGQQQPPPHLSAGCMLFFSKLIICKVVKNDFILSK